MPLRAAEARSDGVLVDSEFPILPRGGGKKQDLIRPQTFHAQITHDAVGRGRRCQGDTFKQLHGSGVVSQFPTQLDVVFPL